MTAAAILIPVYTSAAEASCREMAAAGRGEVVEWATLPIGQHYGPSGLRALIGFRAEQAVIAEVRRAACRRHQAAGAGKDGVKKPSAPVEKINMPSDPMSDEEYDQVEQALNAAADDPEKYGWFAYNFASTHLPRLDQYGVNTRFSAKQREVIWGIRLKMDEASHA